MKNSYTLLNIKQVILAVAISCMLLSVAVLIPAEAHAQNDSNDDFDGESVTQTIKERIQSLLGEIDSLRSQLRTRQGDSNYTRSRTAIDCSNIPDSARALSNVWDDICDDSDVQENDRPTIPITYPGLSVPGSCSVIGNLTMYRGSKGNSVQALQNFLGSQGYFADEATGFFGELTERAVQKYQAAQGIASNGTPDSNGYGVWGPQTRATYLKWCQDADTAELFASLQQGDAPLEVEFTTDIHVSGRNFVIDFGDGSERSAFVDGDTVVEHTYKEEGGYNALLLILPAGSTNPQDKRSVVVDSVGIRVGDKDDYCENEPPSKTPQHFVWYEKCVLSQNLVDLPSPPVRPESDYDTDKGELFADPKKGVAPLEVEFTADIHVSGHNFVIDFGDKTLRSGLVDGDTAITHTYKRDGLYRARLMLLPEGPYEITKRANGTIVNEVLIGVSETDDNESDDSDSNDSDDSSNDSDSKDSATSNNSGTSSGGSDDDDDDYRSCTIFSRTYEHGTKLNHIMTLTVVNPSGAYVYCSNGSWKSGYTTGTGGNG